MRFLVELLTKWDLDPRLMEILVHRELTRDFRKESLEIFIQRLKLWLYLPELYFQILRREQKLLLEQRDNLHRDLEYIESKLKTVRSENNHEMITELTEKRDQIIVKLNYINSV